jgi:[ribosomal protein S5]-alanine N-acetyltransferase
MPTDARFACAEIEDRAAFARLLAASIPDDWPPESLADALPLFLKWLGAAPDCVGWAMPLK